MALSPQMEKIRRRCIIKKGHKQRCGQLVVGPNLVPKNEICDEENFPFLS